MHTIRPYRYRGRRRVIYFAPKTVRFASLSFVFASLNKMKIVMFDKHESKCSFHEHAKYDLCVVRSMFIVVFSVLFDDFFFHSLPTILDFINFH